MCITKGKRNYKLEKFKNNQNQIYEISVFAETFILPPRTKQLTVEMNPDKNELNGNVPTKQQ